MATADQIAQALDAVLSSEVGRQVFLTLASGQGKDTDDGRAWMRARLMLAEHAGCEPAAGVSPSHEAGDGDAAHEAGDAGDAPPDVSSRAKPSGVCDCLKCRPVSFADPGSIRMAVCPTCGDKRCVHAKDHEAPCAKDDIYAHNLWVERHA